ncbi:MAG: alpha/beta hydrolase family protein [Verrucomicrobiota bacterium JB024]|nr:alpha/beta hydrolase family protein [Verrucomicrobiota bacterium JB024]
MAFIQCSFFSEALEMSSTINVILPQQTAAQVGMQGRSRDGRHPVLWLLHGRTDDHTIWMRRTSIERYVAELGLAVVMPNVHLSWYQDMAMGPRYFTYLAEELPRLCRQFFPLSDRREDNFIAGLSMGGYGAFLHALRHPENFAAAASLSGALDLPGYLAMRKAEGASAYAGMKQIFHAPDALTGSDADLCALATRALKNGTPLPALYACCGTEDFLYEGNQHFRQFAADAGLPLTYEEGPGTHQWAFWDQWIQRVLTWLPLQS